MTTRITRRDTLKLLGGVALGTFLTPLPWKLVDDLAIWTQNEDWAAPLPRGARSTHRTRCPLCPAGCALAVRCVAGRPYGIAGAAAPGAALGDVIDRTGRPCALGLAAHRFALHPWRLQQPLLRTASGRKELTVDEALSTVSTWAETALRVQGPRSIAFLDLRPGRSVSHAARAVLAALGGGLYVVAPSPASPLRTAQRQLGENDSELAWNLTGCRTVLSFGAPLLDDWGRPGRLESASISAAGPSWRNDERGAGTAYSLVQIEPVRSRTAQQADRWLPIRPGTETALALGLAYVIVHDDPREAASGTGPWLGRSVASAPPLPEDVVTLVDEFPPDRVSALTGIPREDIVLVARQFASERPSVAIAGADAGVGRLGREEETAVHVLNLLVEAVGPDRPIAPRRALPAPWGLEGQPTVDVTEIEDIPDRSIELLVVDAIAPESALPWSLLQRKLVVERGHVVVLSPYDGMLAHRADLALPVAAALEGWAEIPAAGDVPVSAYALSAPLLKARSTSMDPVGILARLARDAHASFAFDLDTHADLIERQMAAIHATGRGTVVDPENGQVHRTAGVDLKTFARALREGGGWSDEPMAQLSRREPPWPSREGMQGIRELADGRLTRLARSGTGASLVLLPHGWRVTAAGQPLPPVLAKLSRESDLREAEGTVSIHPDTARRLGTRAGADITLQNLAGRARVRVHVDPRVPPGVLWAAVGMRADGFGDAGRKADGNASAKARADAEPAATDSILDLCAGEGRSSWRLATVKVVEV
jgi:anaerobic selenocysteine-containing dehydrogenase